MAQLTWTIAAGAYPADQLRRLITQLKTIAASMPDGPSSSGAATVITFDNAVSGGSFGVGVTAGPVTTSTYKI